MKRLAAIAMIVSGLALLLHATATAQPTLNFNRITVNWPTVELYLSAGCNGNPAYNMAKQDFRIFEDGVEVRDFTLWCPDPTMRCAISAALVFDASGSMSGTWNAGVKAGGRAFVDQMDGQIDEAAVIWFNTQVNTQQQLTTLKPLLNSAIDALPTAGGTAVWDAIHAGLVELISNGVNQCRAVIVVTDGRDNASTRTTAEVIALANSSHIRVFTIGLGSSINATELQMIALLTGGRYFPTSDAGQLPAIYKEISTLLFQSFRECRITYDRDCADGTMRTVDLHLTGFCGGTDTATGTYRTPLDSTTFSHLQMRLGDVHAIGGSAFQVPLELVSSINPEAMFHPFDFVLHFDAQCMQFNGVSTPPGSMLEGVPIQVTPVAGGVHIATADRTLVQGSGLLMQFTFDASSPQDSAVCILSADSAGFEQGCFIPDIADGRVAIYAPPEITPAGPHALCEGDSIVLEAPAGFAEYQWSSGQASRRITVKRSGDYRVTLRTSGGIQVTTKPVTVVVHARPVLRLAMTDTVHICEGSWIRLALASTAGLSGFQWSNGMSSETIAVSKAGTYFVRAADTRGCYGTSDSVTVVVDRISVRLSESGVRHFCEGDSLMLGADAGFASYLWSNGDTTASTLIRSSGFHYVLVKDAAGCQAVSDTLEAIFHDPPTPVITRNDSLLTTVQAAAYQWFRDGQELSGETNRSIIISATGTYRVRITDAYGCSAMSDPFVVTSTGIDRPAYIDAFDVYPDPNDGTVNVSISSALPVTWRIAVMNVLGQLVYERNGDRPVTRIQQQVDLRSTARGIYILRIETGEDIWTRRIVRQ